MKAKFIINPSSGKELLQKSLDRVIGNLFLENIIDQICIVKTTGKHDAYNAAKSIQKGEYDFVVSVGGDGTLNEVVNGIIDGQSDTPIAIMPAGTVNDFANYIRTPKSVKDFCGMIKDYQIISSDVGQIGSQYFINVAACGLLADVGYKVPVELKTVLGKFAYYVTGAFDLPKQFFKSFKLSLTTATGIIEEDALIFIITNTPSVGGFKKLAPRAQINDGLFDVFLLKKTEVLDIIPLLLQLVTSDYMEHPNISYFQTSHLEIMTPNSEMILDIDGEQGPPLPVTIKVVPNAVKFLVPTNYLE